MAILRIALVFSGSDAAAIRRISKAECLPLTQTVKSLVCKQLVLQAPPPQSPPFLLEGSTK
jgi:hypothetical protein